MSAQTRQLIGSLLVAAVIVALTIVAVTAKLGPTSAAELEQREDRAKERQELREERLEEREDSGR
jgi:lipopolysaccharide export LptBFGC system permease protein LptF